MPTSQAITFEQRGLRAAQTAIGFPLGPGIAIMIFRGIAQQVAAVRRFVESEIRDHPALDNAVLMASELAANAIAHSVSGADGVQPASSWEHAATARAWTGADPPGPAWCRDDPGPLFFTQWQPGTEHCAGGGPRWACEGADRKAGPRELAQVTS